MCLYFINKCLEHLQCQALFSVLCKYLVWSSSYSYEASIVIPFHT